MNRYTFGVVALGPVVSGSRLSKDKVIGSEDLAVRSWSDWVHGAWLKIDKNGSWDVLSSRGFIVVDVDTFQLKK